MPIFFSCVATNFYDIKLKIINLTPLPSQKKPDWHLQKVEKKNTDQNPEFGAKPGELKKTCKKVH
jgi:hypothetical protein